jgi:hypothetical protein
LPPFATRNHAHGAGAGNYRLIFGTFKIAAQTRSSDFQVMMQSFQMDNSMLDGTYGSLGAILDIELDEQAFQMCLDRVLTNEK